MTDQYPTQSFGTPLTAVRSPVKKAGLFDVGFTRYLSLTLISVWYVAALVIIGLSAAVGVIVGLFVMTTDDSGPILGFLWIVGSLVGAVVFAVLTRLFLEGIAVLFRIANNTSHIAERTW